MPSPRAADAETELAPLMSRLARGDRSAFDPLYAALRPRALGLARRRVGPAEAADVAQTALLKVFARASEFTPGRACLPWFYAIVANEIRSSQRRGARLVVDDAVAREATAPDDGPESHELDRELEAALEAAILELDHDAAEAVYAVLGRGPVPAIAAPTFRKRVSRAYAKLRFLLGGHDVRDAD